MTPRRAIAAAAIMLAALLAVGRLGEHDHGDEPRPRVGGSHV